MKNKILWIITFLPTLITIVVIQFMADQVPAHYDAMGNVNRIGSKYENFIFPVIIIVATIFWSLFLRYYRKVQKTSKDEKAVMEAQQNEKVIYYVAVGEAVLFGVMHCSSMLSSIIEVKNNMSTMAIDINVVANVTSGILFIIIGNILPKVKRNSVIGIRTASSMKNDEVWAKSNRFAGIAFIISGIIIIAESLIIKGIISTLIMAAVLIIAAIVSAIYAYRIAEKSK